MKKHNLYILTFLAVSLVIVTATFITTRYLYHSAKENLFQNKFEAAVRESREIGKLLELQLEEGIPKEKVIENLQNSIVNTDIKSDFICMYNTNGIEICHPNPALVGQKIDENNSVFYNDVNVQSNFNTILQSGNGNVGIRKFPKNKNRSSQIVSVYPVKGSDWMLASHTNIKVLEAQVSNLYLNFLLSFIISVVLILTLSFFLIKKIYKSFILQTEQEIDYLNEQIINLTALNNQLNNQQVKINDSYNEQIKKRITTYHKDELISISVTDIAFISLQDTVIYIQMFDGMRYAINSSLDEISKVLDPKEFYRANRQCLINIRAISSILLYGKNQLKLILKPDLKEYVIISKNKASHFKNWLEQ